MLDAEVGDLSSAGTSSLAMTSEEENGHTNGATPPSSPSTPTPTVLSKQKLTTEVKLFQVGLIDDNDSLIYIPYKHYGFILHSFFQIHLAHVPLLLASNIIIVPLEINININFKRLTEY